jgi:hypothetical protein
MYNPALCSVLEAPIPQVRNRQLRSQPRKIWAIQIRQLFKDLGIKGVSVTVPNYSMAQVVNIRLPSVSFNDEHEAQHLVIDSAYRAQADPTPWMGFAYYCPICQEQQAAHKHIKEIVLAAFPDLDDRSDPITDYFDACLSVS